MSEYRTRRPDLRQRDIDLLAARRVAVSRLVQLHRDDFDRLLDEARAEQSA